VKGGAASRALLSSTDCLSPITSALVEIPGFCQGEAVAFVRRAATIARRSEGAGPRVRLNTLSPMKLRPALLTLVFLTSLLGQSSRAADTFQTLASLTLPPIFNGSAHGLILAQDGFLWATSNLGGASNVGTIFKVLPDGTQFQVVASFNAGGSNVEPSYSSGTLLEVAAAHELWGVTSSGGAAGSGAIFKINEDTGAMTTMASFKNDSGPDAGQGPVGGLVDDGQGHYWGTTQSGGEAGYGVVFKFTPSTGELKAVGEFTGKDGAIPGDAPLGRMVQGPDGKLWGTTQFGGVDDFGTVFVVDPVMETVTSKVEFTGTDGANPGGTPRGDLASDGSSAVWGTTYNGGANGTGTVFAVDTATGLLTTKVDFTAQSGTATAGANPASGLLKVGGFFWGTAASGATNGAGTIYTVNIATGAVQTVLEVAGSATSGIAAPVSALTGAEAGAPIHLWCLGRDNTANAPALLRFALATSDFDTKTPINDAAATPRGQGPISRLVDDGSGLLWGTTSLGGSAGAGAIFTVTAGGTAATVTSFTPGTLGNFPKGGLVSDGTDLWGTTIAGGANNVGTIYKVGIASHLVQKVSDFSNLVGRAPAGELVDDGQGFFWGVTQNGGDNDKGTIFKVEKATGNLNPVVAFTGTAGGIPGRVPTGTLVEDNHGVFWGMTGAGGGDDLGTVFKVDKAGNFTSVASFTNATAGTRGRYPLATLYHDGSGTLWGTTSRGAASGYGALFKIDAGTGTLTVLTPLPGYPYSTVAGDGAGYVYCLHSQNTYGAIFRYDIATGTPERRVLFTGPAPGAPGRIGSSSTGASLIPGSNGGFYATVDGGTKGGGTVFYYKATDFATETPTLSQPLAGVLGQSITVKYTLPEVAKSNTAFLGFGPTRKLNLKDAFATAGEHTITFNPKSPGSAPGNPFIGPSAIPDGTYLLKLAYQDGIGHPAASTSGVTVQIDTTAPVIDPSNLRPFSFADSLADFTSPSLYTITDSTTVTLTQSPQAGTVPVGGPVDVTVTATDAAGNISTVDFSVELRPQDVTSLGVAVASAKKGVAGSAVPGSGGISGVPGDATLTSVATPAIDDRGNVAFIGKWTSGTTKGTGLFTDSRVVATIGAAGPGGTGTYKTISAPLIDNGKVAFLATLSGVPKGRESVVVSDGPNGTLEIIAQSGTDAGLDGALFKSFKQLSYETNVIGFLAQLATGGTGAKVSGANDLGLWAQGGSGALTPMLRKGDPVTNNVAGTPLTRRIKTLVSLTSGMGSPGQGRGWFTNPYDYYALALVLLDDKAKTQAVIGKSGSGDLFLYSVGGSTTDGEPTVGTTFQSYSWPAFTEDYAVSFLATLTPGGTVTKASQRGIFFTADGTASPHTFAPIVRLMDTATGTGNGGMDGNFSLLKDPVLARDSLAFAATIKGGTVKGASASTLWWKTRDNALSLYAQGGHRQGMGVPGVSTDAEFKSFDSLAIATTRGPIFTATLAAGKGGVTSKTAKGAWGADFTGALRPILQIGTAVPVDATPAHDKTLKSFTFLTAVPGSTGVSRNFNRQGQFVWLATFTDGSTGIIRTEIP
jgi:uncharacterized repeat protein (TIGR03803 family)